jgi:hypothetical protein
MLTMFPVDLLGTHFVVAIARGVRSDGFPRFGFLAVKVYGQTFTAVTRVRIPSGTPSKINYLELRLASGEKLR